MAYDANSIELKLYERMGEFFYPGADPGDTWRLNIKKLAEIVSGIEDDAYERGYDNGVYGCSCHYF